MQWIDDKKGDFQGLPSDRSSSVFCCIKNISQFNTEDGNSSKEFNHTRIVAYLISWRYQYLHEQRLAARNSYFVAIDGLSKPLQKSYQVLRRAAQRLCSPLPLQFSCRMAFKLL